MKVSRLAEYSVLALLAASGVLLIGLQVKPWAWGLLALAALGLLATSKDFRKYVVLLVVSLAIIGLTPISTDLEPINFVIMGVPLIIAAALPYLVSRFIYKDDFIKFDFASKHVWNKPNTIYLVCWVLASYFILPIYFATTAAELNWSVPATVQGVVSLFIAANALGIWDEIFFMGNVLAIIRRFVPFWFANLVQATIFISFLYELGFTEWAVLPLAIFTLLQGYFFNKTGSLNYILTIHLVIDFFLFLALLNAHHPTWPNIFIN